MAYRAPFVLTLSKASVEAITQKCSTQQSAGGSGRPNSLQVITISYCAIHDCHIMNFETE